MKRREFLNKSTKAIALGSIIPGFSFSALNNQSNLSSLLADVADKNDHVLVLIQLNGGNDGLNTLIPKDQYDNLSSLRSNVLIEESKILKLDDTEKTGLHPSMTGIQNMYNEGKINFIQGVGYPEQNYSHFRSTDIWLTASDANTVKNSGWMGRYLNYEFPDFPNGYPDKFNDPLAVQIGALISPGFQGPGNDPSEPLPGNGIPMAISITSDKDFYDLVNGSHSSPDNTAIGKELAFVREMAGQAKHYNQVVKEAAEKVIDQADYPDESLANQLKIVAKLIKGGLKSKIYMVSITGFDTHSAQVENSDHSTGTHADLLTRVSEAIAAFQNDLKFLSIEDKVIGMTFSEFGRRIVSNGSDGTDHGASLPVIVFGTNVQSGIIGVNPTIDKNFTVSDNLAMQYDFRSVYASLLQQWFCVPEEDIDKLLFKDFQSLPILKSTPCTSEPLSIYQKNLEENRLQCYPSPFTSYDTISIEVNSYGGYSAIEVFNTEGKVVKTLHSGIMQPGVHKFSWKGEYLPNGFYYCRFQNEGYQSVFTIQKIR